MFGASFGNSLSSATASANAGADLDEVETSHLALQAAEITSGDRLKFFPEPWPADKQPPPTASLLSIASQKGLLAAAGPSTLVVTGTDKLRAAYIARRRKKDATNGLAEDEPKIKLVEPDVSLSVPRVSHVAFNSDESCLVIAAEEGGGLAVYDTNALTSGGRDPAFQLSTNGTTVRHLIPNPSADPSLAYFFGVVLSNGQFVLADLKERKLVNKAGSSNPVFYENVVCAAWSKLGKQLVLGLENGSAVQVDREGAVKGQIPAPPQLAEIKQNMYDGSKALPICSVAWLANHEFLFIYSPFNPPAGDDIPPTDDSVYFIAQRENKDQPYTFHRLMSDPCAAFVQTRVPAHHFIARLNDWKPSLTDALIIASSAAIDIGIFAKFKDTNQFTTAVIKDEARRATLPLSFVDNVSDTTPVGVAYDFSVQELTPRPIPTESDVLPDSPVPLPALCVLNTEGVLSMFWVVYDDSIRNREAYPAMTRQSGPHRTYEFYSNPENVNAAQSSGSPFNGPSAGLQPQSASTTTSLFSSSESGNNSPAQAPAFGKPAFGTPSTPGAAFGASSGLGKQGSVWGTPGAVATSTPAATPAFGKPSFGSATPAAPAFGKPAFGAPSTPAAAPAFGKPSFGSATPIANKPAFGQPSFGSSTPMGGGGSTGTAFGQPSGFGANKASPWGSAQQPSTGSSDQQASGFAKFGSGNAAASGFAAFAGGNAPSPFGSATDQQNKPSPFGNAASSSPAAASPFATFGSQNKSASPFGSAAPANGSASPFGAAGAAAQNKPSSFGTGAPVGQPTPFGAPALAKETSMASTATLGSTGSSFSFGQPSTIGSGSFLSKPAQDKEETMEEDSDSAAAKPAVSTSTGGGMFGAPSGGFKLGSTFKGDGSAKDDLPPPKDAGAGMFGSAFGNLLKTDDKPRSADTPSSSSTFSFIKKEPEEEEKQQPSLKDIPEAPKAAVTENKVPEDAPLPPDPTTFKAPAEKIPDDMPLPPDPSTTTSGKQADKVAEDAPLPPDPTVAVKKEDVAPAKTSLFGSTPAAAGSTPSFFGAKSGGQTTPSLFGAKTDAQTKPSPFAPKPAGSTPSLFGAKTDAQAKPSPFAPKQAGSTPSLFGAKPATTSPFAPKTSPFAPKPATSPFAPKETKSEDPPALEDGSDEEEWEEEDESGEEELEDGEIDEEDEDDEEDEEEDEEEGEEEEEDEPQQAKISDRAGLEAFKQRITPASPKASTTQDTSTTPQSMAKTSYTPAGLPRLGKVPTFDPPAPRPQLSPRSPSPVRAVTSPMIRPDHPQMRAVAVPPAAPIERRAVTPKPVPETDAGELQDREDDRIRIILATPAEPIKTLESFLTHQEYTGSTEKPGIPGQIERVYRDINAMVDVAGLNARHIAAFVEGQKSLGEAGTRTVEDLEDSEAWVLEDLKDIPAIVESLEKQLNEGRLANPADIIAKAREHEQDLVKLKNKTAEIRRAITAHTDPERLAAQEAAPLNAETQAQQAELRQRVQEVQKLLTDIEEKMSLLRVDIASVSARTAAAAAEDNTNQPPQGNVPTVEAVINTILKMTAMVEQRSGDIDVLEAQIRRLPQGIESLKLPGDYEDSLVSKMRGSRFNIHGNGNGSPVAATTPRRRMAPNGDALGMSAMFGMSASSSRFRTPPSASVLARSQALVLASPGGESARKKKMADVTPQEVVEYKRLKERRGLVLGALKTRVLERGAKVVKAE